MNKLRSFLVLVAIILFSVTLLLMFIVCCLFFGSIKAFRWIAPRWGRGVLWISGIRVDVEGVDKLGNSQSFIVVANHGSQIDIPIITAFLPLDLKWVVKKELAKHPIIGVASWLMGNVFVDRSNFERAVASLKKIQSVIKDGICLLFFPEGTRSKSGEMLPFKSGAFVMAQQLRLPILPVSIVNASSLMPSGQISPKSGRVKLVVHEAIAVDSFTELEAKVIAIDTRKIIQAEVEPHLLNDL